MVVSPVPELVTLPDCAEPLSMVASPVPVCRSENVPVFGFFEVEISSAGQRS